MLGVLALLTASAASAQDYRYHLYVDRDVNAATGCTVNYPLGAIAGAELRISAQVTGTTVTAVTTANCSAGVFGPEAISGGPHAVGLNNGTGGADVIEFAADRGLFGNAGAVRVALASENGALTASDLLVTLQPSGGPILLALSNTPIPIFGGLGLLLLVAALLFVASRRIKLGLASIGALLVAGAVWAANFAVDGAVGDWAGVPALATDPTGDSSGPDVGTDIVALFAAEESGRVYARVDVVDVENQAPVANAQAQVYLEDAPAQTITLTASDADGDPLTFAIQTAPTRGVLGPIVPINATSASVSYTPNANEFGADSFTFVANDGLTNSAPATVSITLTPVNDVPVFTVGPNVTVIKDIGAQTINPWATGIAAGPANEAGQTLTFTITANDNPGMFSVAPAVAANGALSFTTAPNANGTANLTVQLQDNGGTANGGVDTAAGQAFTITLTPVNDAPSFTAGPNQTVLEDAGPQTVNPWATAISAGPPDEAGQTLAFNVINNTNPALFSAGPAVSPTGELTYTPAANANGTATITLVVQDNGGTANGGIDTSAPQNFTITVTPVNDAPSFNAQTPVDRFEDSGAQVATVANAILAGPVDENAQILTFTITNNTNPALFSGTPSVDAAGQLSFTPATNLSGTAVLTLQLQDNGGTANGGVDTSATQDVTVNIIAVNDAPSFTVGPDQTVNEDAGPQTVNPWATAISAGPADEAGQTLTFNITSNSNAALFSAGPAVSPTGELTYTPAADASGVAIITLRLQDNGGIANGGVDTSVPQNFTITVNAVNDAPVNTVPAGPLSVATGATLAIAGVSVADVDAAAGSLQTTLNVAPLGTLTVTPSGGAGVVGSGTSTVTITGALPALNATLATLQFSSAAGGNTTLSVTTNDQGNTGSGGPLSDGPDTVAITIDKAPEVSSVNPVNGATGVLIGSNVVVTFDEAVTVTGNWAQLVCSSSGTRSVGGGTLVVTDADPMFTLDPTVDLTAGETCTLTVFATQVTDDDAIDPPDTMAVDFTSNFVTQDLAPTITSTTPIAAAIVSQNQTLTLNFSEAVNVAAGAISWNCGGAVAFTPALPQNGVTILVLTPSTALNAGAACTVSVESTLVTDADAVDPPNELDGDASGDANDGDADDFALAFSVDAAPAFTTSVPANGDISVSPSANLVVNFSEAVDATAASFTIDCGGGDLGEVVTGSGSAAITLNPNADLPGGANCTVTGVPLQINDSDLIDPPANPAPFSFSFTTASLALDDNYNVTPHLTLTANAGTQGEIDANDQLGTGAITGFGPVGNCNANTPNGTNFATTAGNGRVVLSLDGSFTYFPAQGVTGVADAFCYTVTGGDTAQVNLNHAATELVWFVDNTPTASVCTGNNVGAQACPAATTGAVTAVDTANDTIFVASGNYTGQTALAAGERLIGDGSSSDLQTITTIVPVSGSSFPAFSATAPNLFAGSLTDCVVLATNNTIRGVTITSCGGAGGDSSDINGNGFGTLTVSETTLNGTGRTLNLTNGALAGSFLGVSTTAATGDGMTLATVSGTMNFGPTTIAGVGAAGIGVNINSSSAALTFGGLSVTKTANGAGVNINASTGAITTGALSITTSNGGGLTFDNSTGALNIASGSISATGGPAINSSTSPNWNATLATVSSTNSATQGINLNGIGGTLAMNGGSITGATGTAFFGQGTLGTTTYAGTISKTNAGKIVVLSGAGATTSVTLSGNLTCNTGCTGLDVLSRNAGTYTFSGGTKTLNTGANPAVTLTSNGGATIDFTGGGLDIDTTSGAGFTATGPGPAATTGGTVSVQGANNTIASGSGVALTVANTTIGASGLTFVSVAANGAANGIVLNNTGASGGLTVNGDGSGARNGSGGTINATIDDGIALTATRSVTLRSMILSANGNVEPASVGIAQTTAADHAVQIENSQDIVLSGFDIVNPVGGGILALNLQGTNRVNSNTRLVNAKAVTAPVHAVFVSNSVNMTLFEFDNSRIESWETAANVFQAQNSGAANIAVTVNNSTITTVSAQALSLFAGAPGPTTGTMTSTVSGSVFSNAQGVAEANVGVLTFNGATHASTVQNNTFDNIAEDGSIANTSIIRTQNAGGRLTPRVLGNTVQNIAYAAGGRHVVGQVYEPAAYVGGDLTDLTFDNNIGGASISYATAGREGVFIDYRPTASNGHARVRGNTFAQTNAAATQQMMELRFRQTNASTSNLLVAGNNLSGNVGQDFVDIDVEAAAIVNATVNAANVMSNSAAAPPDTISIRTEAATSVACANFATNSLDHTVTAGPNDGTIELGHFAGSTLRVVQTDANQVASANSIPNANVVVTGTPTFNQPACTLPP